MLDLLIKGGSVVDGTGVAQRTCDIGIKDGVIAEMGKISTPARRTIDADGALVTPGWVDAHTHYDGQATWDDTLEGSAANGVTSIVMGNCGVGFAPVRPGDVKELIDLMEGVEDIPGTALYEGIPWGKWESFPEYIAFLETRRWTVDVATQIPHGALRFYAMGARALKHEAATADDLAVMRELARGAVAAGAVGFSTSRILGHRSMSGESVPGTFAEEAELTAIAAGIKAGGGAVLQAIPGGVTGENETAESERENLMDELTMFARISRSFQLPFVFTTVQFPGFPTLWRDVLDLAARENDLGALLRPMVSPRPVTALTSLGSYHIFGQRPTYKALAHLPHDELVQAMRRPEVKQAILAEADIPHPRPGASENTVPGLFGAFMHLTFPLVDPVDYEPLPEHSLAAQAAAQGREQQEFMYDFLLGDNGHAVAMFLISNYLDGNLDVCGAMMKDPNTVTGLSDAGAHVNFISDMSMPTFNLTHWVRDRARGDRLPIELVVAKSTSATARAFGLADRGTLEVGKQADVNLIDLPNLRVHPPRMLHDLPAGGSRFIQPSTGYLATVMRGEIVRQRDQDTGARPGRLTRPAR